jgi:hypothetical protein
VRCTRACLDPKLGWYPRHLTLLDLRTPLGLAPLKSRVPTLRDLAYMSINELSITWCNA